MRGSCTVCRRPRLRRGDEDALSQRWLSVLARDPAYNLNFSLGQPKGFQLAEPSLSWRPLIWRPLPVVLVHPSDRYGSGHYRAIRPMEEQSSAGLIDGVLSMALLSPAELARVAPYSMVFQRHIGEESLSAMRRAQAFSRSFKVFELNDHLPSLAVGRLPGHDAGIFPTICAKLWPASIAWWCPPKPWPTLCMACIRIPGSSTVAWTSRAGGVAKQPAVCRRQAPGRVGGRGLAAGQSSSDRRGGESLATEVDWVFMGLVPRNCCPMSRKCIVVWRSACIRRRWPG